MMCAALDRDAAPVRALEAELPKLALFLSRLPRFRPIFESLAEMSDGPAFLRHLVERGGLDRLVAQMAEDLEARERGVDGSDGTWRA